MGRMYDDLAELYHLVYVDWEAAIRRQAASLHAVISQHFPGTTTIHDVSCGIGTQVLGLLDHGYRMSGSDLSAASIRRLRKELQGRNKQAHTFVADMSDLSPGAPQVDVIISCDNSITHLADPSAIRKCLAGAYAHADQGVILTVRDYAHEDFANTFRPYGRRRWQGVEYFLFQNWTVAADRKSYVTELFIVKNGDDVSAQRFRDTYHVHTVDDLISIGYIAGFTTCAVVQSDHYQPVIVLKK